MLRIILPSLLLGSLAITAPALAQAPKDGPTQPSADTDKPSADAPPPDDAEAPQPDAPPPVAEAPNDRAAARALGSQALKLYEQKRYAAAYERFEMANRLLNAPTLLLFMARCQREQGQWVAAGITYRKTSDMVVSADDPPQFQEAINTAQQEHAELKAKTPSVSVKLAGSGAAQAELFIDERRISPDEAEQPIALDPGEHLLRASIDGGKPVDKRITLKAGGGVTTLTLTIETKATPTPTPETPPDTTGSTVLWPAAIGYSVGGAGIVAGAITGLLAMNKINDVRSRCIDDRCPPAEEAQADEAAMLANISTAGFVIGGVGLAAGLALTIWAPTSGPDDEAADDKADSGPSAQLLLRPGSVMLRGSF